VRNPFRPKNLRLRFLPLLLLAALVLLLHEPGSRYLRTGLAVVAAGLALRAWGVGHLVKRDRLTVTGPYAHLRHPLYAGTLLIGLGFALALDGWTMWGLLAGTVAWFSLSYFPRKERGESALLEERYGGAYALYRAQVPALLPALRPWQPTHAVARSVGLSDCWRGARWVENNELGTLLGVLAGVLLLWLRGVLA